MQNIEIPKDTWVSLSVTRKSDTVSQYLDGDLVGQKHKFASSNEVALAIANELDFLHNDNFIFEPYQLLSKRGYMYLTYYRAKNNKIVKRVKRFRGRKATNRVERYIAFLTYTQQFEWFKKDSVNNNKTITANILGDIVSFVYHDEAWDYILFSRN